MLRFFDKMSEVSTSTGTGNVTLSGASTFDKKTFENAEGFQVSYHIKHGSLAEYELGIGTILTSPRRLQRDVVLRSSNSDNLVNFSSGNKTVFTVLPADFMHELFGCMPSNLYIPPQLFPGSGIYIDGGQIMVAPEYIVLDSSGDSSAILDCHETTCFAVIIDRTTNLRLENMRAGQEILIKIKQSQSNGNNTVTWYNNIDWAENTPYSISGNGKSDIVKLIYKDNNRFDGIVVGKNFPRD